MRLQRKLHSSASELMNSVLRGMNSLKASPSVLVLSASDSCDREYTTFSCASSPAPSPALKPPPQAAEAGAAGGRGRRLFTLRRIGGRSRSPGSTAATHVRVRLCGGSRCWRLPPGASLATFLAAAVAAPPPPRVEDAGEDPASRYKMAAGAHPWALSLDGASPLVSLSSSLLPSFALCLS